MTDAKCRPVIMSAESVRAILDGRKTQTRRVVNLSRLCVDFIGGRGMRDDPDEWGYEGPDGVWYVLGRGHRSTLPGDRCSIRCPFGRPGDRLWVRETWCVKADMATGVLLDGAWWYRADGVEVVHVDDHCRSPWRSPIHMPREASRLTLEVTNVRVQRLRDISADDAEAEGVAAVPIDVVLDDGSPIGAHNTEHSGCAGGGAISAREMFAAAWDSLNAKRGCGWEKNPWVWAVTFEVRG